VKDYQDSEDASIELTTSSNLVVDSFRVQVARGEIDHKNLTFEYEGEIITVDRDVRLSHWPIGFCGHGDRALSEIVRFICREEEGG
jgi:hypothetical protein